MQRNNLTVKAKLPRQQLAYLVLSKLLYIRPELATILRKTVRQHIDWRCWALRQKALSQALTERCFFYSIFCGKSRGTLAYRLRFRPSMIYFYSLTSRQTLFQKILKEVF